MTWQANNRDGPGLAKRENGARPKSVALQRTVNPSLQWARTELTAKRACAAGSMWTSSKTTRPHSTLRIWLMRLSITVLRASSLFLNIAYVVKRTIDCQKATQTGAGVSSSPRNAARRTHLQSHTTNLVFLDFIVNHVVVIVAFQLKLFEFGLINCGERFETSAPLIHCLVVVAEDDSSFANVGTGCNADKRLAYREKSILEQKRREVSRRCLHCRVLPTIASLRSYRHHTAEQQFQTGNDHWNQTLLLRPQLDTAEH